MTRQVTLEQSLDLVRLVQKKHKKKTLNVLSKEWLKDSTPFVYKDRGDLQDSGLIHSDFEKGIIRWRTPYSRVRFYLGGIPGDGNRRAKPRWSEVSKKANLAKYKKIQIKLFNDIKREVYG